MTQFRLASCVLGVAATACSKQDSQADKAEHVKRADDFMAQKKLSEAIIEYKITLQANPMAGEVRKKLTFFHKERAIILLGVKALGCRDAFVSTAFPRLEGRVI